MSLRCSWNKNGVIHLNARSSSSTWNWWWQRLVHSDVNKAPQADAENSLIGCVQKVNVSWKILWTMLQGGIPFMDQLLAKAIKLKSIWLLNCSMHDWGFLFYLSSMFCSSCDIFSRLVALKVPRIPHIHLPFFLLFTGLVYLLLKRVHSIKEKKITINIL